MIPTPTSCCFCSRLGFRLLLLVPVPGSLPLPTNLPLFRTRITGSENEQQDRRTGFCHLGRTTLLQNSRKPAKETPSYGILLSRTYNASRKLFFDEKRSANPEFFHRFAGVLHDIAKKMQRKTEANECEKEKCYEKDLSSMPFGRGRNPVQGL